MIIRPKTRGFICITAHPAGCASYVNAQIQQMQAGGAIAGGPKSVLIIGASGGYGLPSWICSAFTAGAATLGLSFERPPTETKTASAGWYAGHALESAGKKAGLNLHRLDADAFASSTKEAVVAKARAHMPPIDLVIYSLASPVRPDPASGKLWRSVIKPIGNSCHVKSLNVDKEEITDDLLLEAASEEEIADTVKVMGGEDWHLWMQALKAGGVLATACRTIAYTYIGSEITWPIYKEGTIGRAKEDLDRAAVDIRQVLATLKGEAQVVALKAVVTQASAAIPVVPLYASVLFRVMKDMGIHEDCPTHIERLFRTQLCADAELQLDADGRIRLDHAELSSEVQERVRALWPQVTTENLRQITDFEGFRADFLRVFGFGVEGVDYEADISPLWQPAT